jgi:hypothetical protein
MAHFTIPFADCEVRAGADFFQSYPFARSTWKCCGSETRDPSSGLCTATTMALILQSGALDFHKRGPITAQLISDKKNPVDDHHIFPRAFLNNQNVAPALRNCLLNRTYIDRTTNRRLSKRAPSD